MTLKMGPMNSKMTFEISEYIPSKKMSFKTVSKGAVHWDSNLTFDSIDPTTTRLTNSGELALQGFWKILEPMMAGEVNNGEQKELDKVKQILENG